MVTLVPAMLDIIAPMARRPLLCGLLVSLIAAAGPDELTRDQLLLARVLQRMSDNLKRLPDYTCLQTIERSRRSSAGQRFEPMDRVRLEVALVDGRELFSWPGAGNFEDRELRHMVLGGATSTGNFGLLARAVFTSGQPNFQHAGERVVDGRRTLRWDYTVPQFRSGYTIRSGKGEATVGFHGSFWADAETLDVIRLEAYADDIPPHLEIVNAQDAVEYARVNVGSQAFLLPSMSELRISDFGGESRNETRFSRCRQYTGESVLLPTDPAEVHVLREPPKRIELPPGLNMRIEVSEPVRSEDAAVGDRVLAKVRSDVKHNGELIVPKGAQITGRIHWLRLQQNVRPMWVLGLTLEEITFGNTTATCSARLAEVLAGDNITMHPRGYRNLTPGVMEVVVEGELRRISGVLFVRPGGVLLPSGLQMVWRTEALPSREIQ
jgi:hypothetical protein